MALSALPFPRYFAYETFLWTHRALAVLMMCSLWRYDGLSGGMKLFLLVGLSAYVLTSCCRLARLIYHNYSFRGGWSRCSVFARTRDLSAVEVRINLARPVHVRSGQYVFLWLPGVSLSAFVQFHPFSIAWWHNDVDGKTRELSLLVKPQHGLTAHLATHANSQRKLLAAVDGPYGKPINTSAYGTILLFASDMGIAGVMAVAKESMSMRHQWKSSTRRVYLIWQVNNRGSLCSLLGVIKKSRSAYATAAP